VTDLARQVDEAQSLLATPAADQARVFERAFATCCRALAAAMSRLDPTSGASAIDIAGGVAVFAGAGSPLTQALAVGLDRVVTAADLDRLESHLCPGNGGAPQLEVCPFVDPSLAPLLAARGYRVQEWQLAWTRAVPAGSLAPRHPPDGALHVRAARPGEEELFLRTVMQGFLETDEVPEEALALMRPSTSAEGHEMFLAFLGDEPVGGGAFASCGEVAFVNGSGVRPAFRRRGAQGALLRARLDRARELGCTVAYSTTQPGTSSCRNMENHGFRVAYPKLAMVGPLRGG